MSRPMPFVVSVCGSLALFLTPATATAQLFRLGNPCPCLQPVAQTCYRTVPVTEYRQVKQIVQRPIIETKYVDQQVTEYRPVTETRTATVPTVSYDYVTEQRTVQRDAGYWTTQYTPNHKLTACQYDSRPNIFGWLNRAGYSIRQSFTPKIIAKRQYVPNVITQTIPVTRRVARHGTRQITYNVTRMVPYTTTRRVAVNTVRYVSQEVTTMRPVTVMRSVPIGTAMSYAPINYGATATALLPTPDPIGTAASQPVDRRRTADSRNNDDRSVPVKPFRREDADNHGARLDRTVPVRHSSFSAPVRSAARPIAPQAYNDDRYDGYRRVNDSRNLSKFPSIIRVSRGWMPSRRASNGPRLTQPTIVLANTNP